ncbi:glycosyltransferase [Syntrophus aciditrophicus]|uniref:Glycosyltransferase involved in cell wall biogenesis n=1 Tax=Syntrophus aciditrophicus (strain SB) TaxID=56780 RepID=Q2LX74_SYNAS|nr:glycosyltransferase [Syntrophus aciditrophicus]ABC78683.1 glycosyltransferase involved in cell wall biogenesis [Syntrophus aciditrophicus SB]OPY16363.1 MAG: Glucosyl-3-phosphoglycerate synthase [Syntrophus sp. PtaB.Bin075]
MSTAIRFSTALRPHVRTKIEQLGTADIVIGVPSYDSGDTIAQVVQIIISGLDRYYRDRKALVMVSDGGSTDDTRDLARAIDPKSYNIESVVTVYRGSHGKGSGLRAVFEVASFLKARAIAVFDSDLLSITPEWIRNILDPVIEGYDFVAPDYKRFKLDGTITNTIAYNLTRALYGKKIRQPIGGDFGVSPALIKFYLEQDVWETDVAKFGVDIWMTTSAIVGGFRICQAKLGAKIHGQKDPSADLGPMFRQVVGTTFQLMERYEDYWLKIRRSRDVPSLGEFVGQEPPAFDISQENLIEYFKVGLQNFGTVWRNIIDEQDYEIVRKLGEVDSGDQFFLPIDTWVRTVYRYAGAFHATPRQRFKVLDTLAPLYYGRVASLVNELRDKSPAEAEAHFEVQAEAFERLKDYMVKIWKQKGGR